MYAFIHSFIHSFMYRRIRATRIRIHHHHHRLSIAPLSHLLYAIFTPRADDHIIALLEKFLGQRFSNSLGSSRDDDVQRSGHAWVATAARHRRTWVASERRRRRLQRLQLLPPPARGVDVPEASASIDAADAAAMSSSLAHIASCVQTQRRAALIVQRSPVQSSRIQCALFPPIHHAPFPIDTTASLCMSLLTSVRDRRSPGLGTPDSSRSRSSSSCCCCTATCDLYHCSIVLAPAALLDGPWRRSERRRRRTRRRRGCFASPS